MKQLSDYCARGKHIACTTGRPEVEQNWIFKFGGNLFSLQICECDCHNPMIKSPPYNSPLSEV
jgi:hypothetical protein